MEKGSTSFNMSIINQNALLSENDSKILVRLKTVYDFRSLITWMNFEVLF